MIDVTPLGSDDRAAWQRLFEGYNAFYEHPHQPPELYDRCWSEIQAGARIHGRGAWLDRRLVGIVHFLPHANTTGRDVCYLQDLFTDPEARGRGVGRALIDAVVAWASERELGRVYWMTHESNATARRLYDGVTTFNGFIRYEIGLGVR